MVEESEGVPEDTIASLEALGRGRDPDTLVRDYQRGRQRHGIGVLRPVKCPTSILHAYCLVSWSAAARRYVRLVGADPRVRGASVEEEVILCGRGPDADRCRVDYLD
jgi:hypothetical protein